MPKQTERSISQNFLGNENYCLNQRKLNTRLRFFNVMLQNVLDFSMSNVSNL